MYADGVIICGVLRRNACVKRFREQLVCASGGRMSLPFHQYPRSQNRPKGQGAVLLISNEGAKPVYRDGGKISGCFFENSCRFRIQLRLYDTQPIGMPISAISTKSVRKLKRGRNFIPRIVIWLDQSSKFVIDAFHCLKARKTSELNADGESF